ncbi:Transcriptional regulatory protein ZraR [Thalassoglobus neptunius]|uniref:Transcriptional regulatory protein ZraR n=2 Tax=Thalassoglobus neptunius TaxID=1938619 RepID=A0A5C5VZ45_9PLAN|nr:Transcriptional regulatory protein ZraR [Thalassoglobus neptunius]
MKAFMQRAQHFARSSAAVLINGESGTGKELFAREIHRQSPRSKNPYVQVNCAALSEQLIESELFGHEVGAFTGAVATRAGRLEEAKDGTLLLDEIGELPMPSQSKLLRVLEERQFQRVGSNRQLEVQARIVTATNRELSLEVQEKRFREDLWHRLNVLTLTIPPLRDRREDIPLLVQYFLKRFQLEGEQRVERVSSSVMRQLIQYSWPGNVRQLRNTILRSCVLATSTEITSVEFPSDGDWQELDSQIPDSLNALPLEEIERRVIMSRISRCGGNKSAAAETLGVTARTLRNKMDRYRKLGLMQEEFGTSAERLHPEERASYGAMSPSRMAHRHS